MVKEDIPAAGGIAKKAKGAAAALAPKPTIAKKAAGAAQRGAPQDLPLLDQEDLVDGGYPAERMVTGACARVRALPASHVRCRCARVSCFPLSPARHAALAHASAARAPRAVLAEGEAQHTLFMCHCRAWKYCNAGTGATKGCLLARTCKARRARTHGAPPLACALTRSRRARCAQHLAERNGAATESERVAKEVAAKAAGKRLPREW
jgi:hypothetical protein